MAIDFPDSPSVDQQYSVGDRTWTWNGTYWQLSQTSSTFTASDDSPLNPSAGDIWFESDTGKTFIYYDQAWVEIGSATDLSDILSDNDGDTLVQVEASTDEDKIRFSTAGTERMTISSAGAVAMTGDLTVDGDLTVSGTTTTLNTTELLVEDNKITLNSGATGSATVDAGIEVERGDDANVEILWDETADAWKIATDFTVDTDTLHVDSTNNRVGIGTTSPAEELDVVGDVQVSGRLGIGSGISAELDIKGASNPEIRLQSTDSSDPFLYFGDQVDAVRGGIGYDTSANTLQLRGYNNSTRLTIDSSGNVGINDTTPSYKLDVNGDINATGDVRVAGAPVGKVLVYEGSVGSGVSSFTASNVFSSAYDNYEVIVSGMDCSIDGVVLGLRLGSSTTAYYYGGYYIIYSSGASGFFSSTVETSWGVGYTDTRGVTGFVAQILCPNLAIRTKFTAVSPGNNVQRSVAGEHSSNTAHTSFTLLPSSGTMTGGVVRVYGHVEA